MTDTLRRYALASYVVALLFIVNPIIDAATNVWPWAPGSEQWRFAAAGVLSNYLVSLIFGLLLAGLVAALAGNRKVLLAIGGLSGLGAAILAVVSISYLLDTFQVRAVVREDQVALFKIGAAKTLFKMVISLLALLALALGSFKAAKIPAAAGSGPLIARGA